MSDENKLLSQHAVQLQDRLANRSALTCVIGLGYVGLPLAVEFANAGFTVIGVDADARKCELVNEGRSYIRDVADDVVNKVVAAGRLSAVAELATAGHLDTINICVPTPLRKTKDPDLSCVIGVAQAVRDILRPGMLITLESTTYPGTTEEVVRGILEETGLQAGTDFFLAFSPERVDPGNEQWNTRNVPKVVGGLTPQCSELAGALYGASIERVVMVSSPRVAEMVKLLENTFRAINIGLVNELAIMCDRIGIDVWEVINAAATKPFGFMPFYPGPGLGGHCIPIDPFYLSWKVKEVGFEARFIELAGQVNAAMPQYVVEKVSDALNEKCKSIKGSQILVLGVSYKRDVSDVRESPALDVIALLLKKGAVVSYHDPHVHHIDTGHWIGGQEMDSVPYSPELLSTVDCVVLLADHSAFDFDEVVSRARLVVDTRNATKTSASNVYKIGAPNPRCRESKDR